MRSSQQKRKDDAAAQDAARDAGRTDYLKARSRAGAHLATTDAVLLGRYITAYRKAYGEDSPVNFAVELGRSNLVVVDCDTAEQTAAFLERSGAPEGMPPTVVTPGARNDDGEWVHSDGGHFYFTLEEGQLDLGQASTGTFTDPQGGYAVMWKDRYVLIPPSVRPEGPYRVVGREYPLPDWIADTINSRTRTRAHHAESVEGDDGEMTEVIDQWAQTISWSDILSPLGWVLTARPDRCGCDVWTAPGDHDSPKSATTHDTGCELGRYTAENAPMHVWTDHPGDEFEEWIAAHGSQTLSKLQAVAVTGYKGNVGTACAELGFLPGKSDGMDGMGFDASAAEDEAGVNSDNLSDEITLPSAADDDDDDGKTEQQRRCPHESVSGIGRCYSCGLDMNVGVDKAAAAVDTAHCAECEARFPVGQFHTDADNDLQHTRDGNVHLAQDVTDAVTGEGSGPDGSDDTAFPDEPATETEENAVLISDDNAVPDMAPFDYWRDIPSPEYAVEGLIEHDALTSIIGPPGAGKSTVALDIACSLVTGQRWQGRKTIRQRVLYLPGEGLSGAVQRIKAWERAHELDVGQDLLLGNAIIQLSSSKDAWATLAGYILRHRVGLIIFDTFARMSLGLEENSATDVGKAITRFDQIRKLTGAGVMVIHHTGKSSPTSRGSSALNGALDTELLVTPGQWDTADVQAAGEPSELTTSKQKNAPRLKDPMPLFLAEMHDSVVVTGASGVVGDPLDSAAVPMLRTPEPVVETSIRLYEYALRFPAQGCTRGELIQGVEPDDYTKTRPGADLVWKRTVHEAVDLGLRYGLIQTLSGTASGMRYVTSTTTPGDARQRAAQEAMKDD